MAMDSAAARQLAPVLWGLLGLFILRVVGQLLVAVGWAPFLPPMEAWQSGLLPYPWLVGAQLIAIGVYGKVCLDFTRGDGFFVTPRRRLGVGLLVVGSVYLGVMVARFIVMLAHAGERWMGGPIPIVFHWVLATFLLVVGAYHRASARPPANEDHQKPISGSAGTP